jgi:hypothetical protein
VALAGADYELALAATADLAGTGILEEAMLEPFDDKPFKPVEGVANLPALDALERWRVVGASANRRPPAHVPANKCLSLKGADAMRTSDGLVGQSYVGRPASG